MIKEFHQLFSPMLYLQVTIYLSVPLLFILLTILIVIYFGSGAPLYFIIQIHQWKASTSCQRTMNTNQSIKPFITFDLHFWHYELYIDIQIGNCDL